MQRDRRRKVWAPIVNRRQTYEVTVAAAALSELILAVHAAAGQAGGQSGRRWHYGNVVGISTPRVRDLTLAKVHAKHVIGRRAIAAITVAAQREVAVDVVFGLDDKVASAQFFCATTQSESFLEQETSWAEYLAACTCATLTATDVAATMSAQYATAAE